MGCAHWSPFGRCQRSVGGSPGGNETPVATRWQLRRELRTSSRRRIEKPTAMTTPAAASGAPVRTPFVIVDAAGLLNDSAPDVAVPAHCPDTGSQALDSTVKFLARQVEYL